jgi:hypothetical protein
LKKAKVIKEEEIKSSVPLHNPIHITPNLKFALKSCKGGKFLHVEGDTDKHASGVRIHGWEGHNAINSTWEFRTLNDD